MPKTAITGTMIAVGIDKDSVVPIYQQIIDGLREAVFEGRVVPGSKLPSTRIFAEELRVSRNTVLQVFETLINEGVLTSRVGDGTYVVGRQDSDALQPASQEPAPTEPQYPFRSISRRGRNLVASASDAFSESPTPFMPDLPDLREFPIRT
jgi:GntR family transcriptional regulator / MocR family aminotransferase